MFSGQQSSGYAPAQQATTTSYQKHTPVGAYSTVNNPEAAPPPPPMPMNIYQRQEYPADYHQYNQQTSDDTMLSMRKHRSLDQFLSQFDPLNGEFPSNLHSQQNYGGNDDQQCPNFESQFLLTRAPSPPPASAYPFRQQQQMNQTFFDATNEPDPMANTWAFCQPISSHSILQQTNFDQSALRRELTALCERFNYLATSVRSFWAPELCRERQRLKEEAFRANQLEERFAKLNMETQTLRAELERRREEEDSGIGRPLSRPRDFTDLTPTLHEWQTLKAKMERSELSLADRTRELQNTELRAKCAEEQKEEVERRNDILARNNAANEAQLKLMHEDVNVLRGKLELKNQQLDTREKANRKLEAELDAVRMELKESQQIVQEAERRAAQLTHRLDQMERELREQNAQMERLNKQLAQQPGTRAETELQQRLENAAEDRRKLEQLVDQLRRQNDAECQQQLEQFLAEREQLEANIANLNKELADRHMLISSQSEKISQLDSAVQKVHHQQQQQPNGTATGGTTATGTVEQQTPKQDSRSGGQKGEEEESELERTHREMERLLKRVQWLEEERAELLKKREGGTDSSKYVPSTVADTTAEMSADERVNLHRQRIRDLEEALRESVECTAEKEKALAEQRRLVEKLSTQVTELFGASGSAAALASHQRQLRDAHTQLAEAQKQLEEERQQRQRQVSAVRKELGMALVAEKEAAIGLVLQCCPGPLVEAVPGLREKLDSLQKQKEALRHALLMSSGPEEQQHGHGLAGTAGSHLLMGNGATTSMRMAVSTAEMAALRSPALVQPGRPLSAAAAFSQPIRIQTTGFPMHTMAIPHNGGLGISAPASLILHQQQSPGEFEEFGAQLDEDGIWA